MKVITIDEHGARFAGSYVERDTGDDDCEAFDPTTNLSLVGRDCPSDGHYRCAECAKLLPDHMKEEPTGLSPWSDK